MTSHTNKMRQLDFIVGYRITSGQRRFAAEANVAVASFLNNDTITSIKNKVRKMKKV